VAWDVAPPPLLLLVAVGCVLPVYRVYYSRPEDAPQLLIAPQFLGVDGQQRRLGQFACSICC
jgi:hypothetical protein